jgi:hypothetical protein
LAVLVVPFVFPLIIHQGRCPMIVTRSASSSLPFPEERIIKKRGGKTVKFKNITVRHRREILFAKEYNLK